MTFNHIVTNEESGKTILALLKGRFRFSGRFITQLKQQEDGILKNGVRAFTNARVQQGDVLCFRLTWPEESAQVLPEEIPLSVVYEDDWLIVLDKPAGLVMHPTHNHQRGTLSNGLAFYYQQRGIRTKIRPVSRLDRDTSGLVLFAKHPWIQDRLTDPAGSLQTGLPQMEKRYIALTHGLWTPSAGIIDLPIARASDSIITRQVSPAGDRAITHYQTLSVFQDEQQALYSLVEFILKTGRTHQIRVHCKASGHPIVGDTLYCDPAFSETLGLSRQALHSRTLHLSHPATAETLQLYARPPYDIQNALARLVPISPK